MAVLRVAGAAILTVVLLSGALIIGQWVHDRRDARAANEAGSVADAAPSATPAAPGSCVTLGQVKPMPAPPLTSVDVGSGMQRVTSAEGGYSIVLPASWTTSPGFFSVPAFGQTHATSYDPKTLPTPGPEAPGILAPKYGVRLDIEIWDNGDHLALDRYASTVRIGPDQSSIDSGTTMDIDGHAAYRFLIRDEHRYQPAPGQLITTKQTRAVWLISMQRDDRLIVAYATPMESDLFPQVEAAVRAIRVTAPVVAQMPVVHQRDEVTARWLKDAKGLPIAGRHVEAKLVSFREAMMALTGYLGISRMDRDFDELVWIIAVSGPDLPGPMSVPLQKVNSGPPATIAPTLWMLMTSPALNDNGAGTGLASGTSGTWPSRFDALGDRCR